MATLAAMGFLARANGIGVHRSAKPDVGLDRQKVDFRTIRSSGRFDPAEGMQPDGGGSSTPQHNHQRGPKVLFAAASPFRALKQFRLLLAAINRRVGLACGALWRAVKAEVYHDVDNGPPAPAAAATVVVAVNEPSSTSTHATTSSAAAVHGSVGRSLVSVLIDRPSLSWREVIVRPTLPTAITMDGRQAQSVLLVALCALSAIVLLVRYARDNRKAHREERRRRAQVRERLEVKITGGRCK